MLTSMPAAAAPVKAGKACDVAKQSRVVGGKKFTCVRVKGKLVWNAGVAVPKPVVTPAPVVTPTPEPTAPERPITFDNLDPKWTSRIARTNLLEKYATLQQPADTVEFLVGEKVKPAQLVEEKRLLNIATRMFSEHFSPSSYQVVFFSELDGEWAEQTRKSVGGDFPYTIPDEIKKWPMACNFAFASRSNAGTPIYYQCMDTLGRGINDKQTAIHEYFHLVQAAYSNKRIPCWVHEGSPTFFGIALGVDGADPTGYSGRQFYKSLSYMYDPDESLGNRPNQRMQDLVATEAGTVKFFKELEFPSGKCVRYGAYAAGGIATEALIAVKGFDTYMQFVRTFTSSVPWEQQFETVFGLTPETFYAKLHPYIRAKLAGQTS